MKRSTIIVLVILALLVSMLPVSAAFAAKATPNTKLTIVNRTSAVIYLSMISSKGLHYSFDIPNRGNAVTLTIPQDSIYSYHAQTSCGLMTGVWNMSKNRWATFYCPSEGSTIHFRSPSR